MMIVRIMSRKTLRIIRMMAVVIVDHEVDNEDDLH